jgi:hypothetical protein
MKKNYFVIAALGSLFLVVVSSCATLVNTAGEALDGSAFREKKLAVYDNGAKRKEQKIELREVLAKEDGGEGVVIRGGDLPGFALRGTMPDSNGRFELTSVDFLSSHYSGWNEFSLALLGSAVFVSGGSGGDLRIALPVERVQITGGRIRLKSSRVSGTEALTSLRNRRERILALTEWMRLWQQEQSDAPPLASQKEFEAYWKPRLLPEMVSLKERPSEWGKDDPQWVKADGVTWNQTYTKLIFPEELWVLRDSGALLRDWEESLPWIYLEYNWDSILASFNEVNLIKKN